MGVPKKSPINCQKPPNNLINKSVTLSFYYDNKIKTILITVILIITTIIKRNIYEIIFGQTYRYHSLVLPKHKVTNRNSLIGFIQMPKHL